MYHLLPLIERCPPLLRLSIPSRLTVLLKKKIKIIMKNMFPYSPSDVCGNGDVPTSSVR